MAETREDIDAGWEVPISAIEHYSYCPRQCALIHVEQIYEENYYTIKGKLAHERVDSGDDRPVRGIKVARAVPLWSVRLGLVGKADLVEFRPSGPYPVEYKVGRRVGTHPDLQLCAQAMCLEEMLSTKVDKGALYYHGVRRRYEIEIDRELRRKTTEIIARIREMLVQQVLPPAVNDKRCRNCSLLHSCLPGVSASPHRVRTLRSRLWNTDEDSISDGDLV